MTNPIVEKIEGWLWQIAVKKGVSFAIKAILSLITGAKLAPIIAGLGITVDPVVLEGSLATLIGSGLTILQNWLKIKFGLKFL